MPREVTVKYVSLRSSLVNLPISIYGPLVEHRVRPQSLAIHLSSSGGQPPRSAYVGWTGMASSSSLAQWQSGVRSGNPLDTVEIDPQFASSLGFAEGSKLAIGLLHDLNIANSVYTEPVSPDDWEILELHAGYVEDTLLSQVRVASVGQEVDVWVLGRTRVRFRVVSLDPPRPALLLATNTEVSIAPKFRTKSPASSKGVTTKSSSNSQPQISSSMQSLVNQVIPRVLPFRFFPAILGASDTTESGAWISPAMFTSLTNDEVALLESPASSHQRVVSVHRLRPPLPPEIGKQNLHDAQPQSPAQPRLLHRGATAGETAGVERSTSKLHAVPLYWCKDVPDDQILLYGVEDIEDWDLVRVQLLNHEDREAASEVQNPNGESSANAPPVLNSMPPPGHVLTGVDAVLKDCYDFTINAFALQAQRRQSRPSQIPGLLLCGRSGSGRTSVVKAVMERLGKDRKVYGYTHYVDLTKYSEERIPALKSLFRYWLDLAIWHKPSVLVLDNLERIVPAELEHADSFRFRHLAEHFSSVFGSRYVTPGVVLIATCQSQAALHPLLMSTHIFTRVVQLKPPTKEARRDILESVVQSKLASSGLQLGSEDRLNYISLATKTEGYLAADLCDLVLRAVHQATIRASEDDSEASLLPHDFDAAQVDFTPLSLRDVKLQQSDVLWSDIGGLHETRRVLKETLEWPTKYGAIFAGAPLRLRSGLLLYGFPGCGKTLLASAVAKECGLNFISVKGPELLNKYIGASEKSVRDLFDRASAAKPCVLFFDEFDAIAPKRGHDSTGVTDRVVNQLLTQMDGAEGLDGVYVLAATSRPDLIDSALLRPGRLDKSLLCNMPDMFERKEIIQAICKKVAISPSVVMEKYARATEGFSGADLQALVYNAHLEVVHSVLDSEGHRDSIERSRQDSQLQYTSFGGAQSGQFASRAEKDALSFRLATIIASQRSLQRSTITDTPVAIKHEIQDEHMQRSLKSARPSVPREERGRLSRIYRTFVSERSGQLPMPPEAGGVGNRVSLM